MSISMQLRAYTVFKSKLTHSKQKVQFSSFRSQHHPPKLFNSQCDPRKNPSILSGTKLTKLTEFNLSSHIIFLLQPYPQCIKTHLSQATLTTETKKLTMTKTYFSSTSRNAKMKWSVMCPDISKDVHTSSRQQNISNKLCLLYFIWWFS